MSHSKERKEKICLNCNAELNGRFCHVCGQENLEPKESAWSLISHFFYDITHFDGKFFQTLGYLVRKPGFLSKEYIRGRRASYLNPIRMYVFSSALFFIIFFAMYNPRTWKLGDDDKESNQEDSVAIATRDSIAARATSIIDSVGLYRFKYKDSLEPKFEEQDTLDQDDENAARPRRKGWRTNISDVEFETTAAYDSAQKAKPPEERDGWLSRKLNHRFIELKDRYGDDGSLFIRDVLDKFIHTFPYLLFISLPLYALYLKLLYVRRKQFYYVDHGIFLVHLYIFTFIVLLVFFGLLKLGELTGWGGLGWLRAILIFYGIFYTIKAMRNFYGQGMGKTFLKFMILNFLALNTLIFLFFVSFIFAAFRI